VISAPLDHLIRDLEFEILKIIEGIALFLVPCFPNTFRIVRTAIYKTPSETEGFLVLPVVSFLMGQALQRGKT
jgi:hypothetical protein